MKKDRETLQEEVEKNEVIILGGADGQLVRYENTKENGWIKTSSIKLTKTITEVLQTANERVLVVQHEGQFDFVDSDKKDLTVASHCELPGFKIINMARMLKRAGEIAYADESGGLKFLNIILGG